MAFWELGQTIWVNIKTKVCCFGVLWVLLWYRLRFHMIISMFSTFQYCHISMLTLSDHRQKNPSEILRRRKGVELQSLDVRFVFFLTTVWTKIFYQKVLELQCNRFPGRFFFIARMGLAVKPLNVQSSSSPRKWFLWIISGMIRSSSLHLDPWLDSNII